MPSIYNIVSPYRCLTYNANLHVNNIVQGGVVAVRDKAAVSKHTYTVAGLSKVNNGFAFWTDKPPIKKKPSTPPTLQHI